MPGRGIVVAVAVAVAAAVAACKSDRAPSGRPSSDRPAVAATGSGSGPSSSAAGAPIDPAAAALPGELWFVEDGPPRRLVRWSGGARRIAIDGELFPSSSRLPDGRVVAIRSKGDGSVDAEQLVLVADDGALATLGPAASQVRDPVVVRGGAAVVAALQLEGRSNLHRIDVATGAVTQLTSDPQGNFRPASLGGEAIVFVSSRDGDAELYRGRASGGAVVRLTAFHRDDFEPVPSPDGKTIAFLSDREGVAPRIFLVSADGTGLRRLTRLPANVADDESEVAWSPDGARLAYVERRRGASRLIVHELATDAQRVLTPDGVFDAEPAWSPDGAWVVVSRARRPARDDADLWALPVAPGAERGAPIQLTSGGSSERLPRWFGPPARPAKGDRPD